MPNADINKSTKLMTYALYAVIALVLVVGGLSVATGGDGEAELQNVAPTTSQEKFF